MSNFDQGTRPVQYPEHEKLKEIQPKSQAIGDFLEWMKAEFPKETRLPPYSIPFLLAEYFEIDEAELEREKRAMLESIRNPHGNALSRLDGDE
jgi:hypothetical protein